MSTIAISLPVESPWWFPSYVENILDKKANQVALNCLEKLVDYFFNKFYEPYSRIYAEKLKRIWKFPDNEVRLFDTTSKSIAKIEFGHIFLNERRVFFDTSLRNMIFSSQTTNRLLVRDAEERGANWVQIVEHQSRRPESPNPILKTWMFDTSFTEDSVNYGEYYLAEQTT